MTFKRVGTPCVGICSTTYGDTVCRGCKRYLHEIVNWNRLGDSEKQVVWSRLDSFLALIVGNYVEVLAPEVLRQQLEYQKIRIQVELSPTGWIPELLRVSGEKPLDWASYGLQLTAEGQRYNPRDLFLKISQEYYDLSSAHYQRYYQQPLNEH